MLSALTGRYAAFFRLPDVARMVAMALLARMPLGMVNLAMLLHVRALTGSYAVAGATVGAGLAASAITAPLVGRWIDRNGARAVLRITGIAYPLGLLIVGFARPLALSVPAIWTAAAFAGAFAPPIAVLTRTMWRYRFDDDSRRRTAFALDSVVIEFVFTAGPGLIAVLLAVGSPEVAFGAAWLFAAVAVPTFMASPALRYLPQDRSQERHLLGPLTELRLLVVYATTFLLAFCLGLLEVAYPGFATRSGHPPLAGILIALNSAGSAVGGFLYGGMHVDAPIERQLRRLLPLFVVPLAIQAGISSAGPLMAAAFVAGLCIAPSLTLVSLLVSNYAPPRYATEAFTWATTCIVSGIGAGNALGGLTIERLGPAPVFAGSALAAFAAALCALGLNPGRNPPA
jgi:MFS family permease